MFEPKLGVNVSKNLILTEGKNRLVSGTTTNNGTIGYIEEDIKGHTYKEGLTVSNRGEYSGSAFYQPTEFILGPNVIYLESKTRVTQESLLYVVALVNKLPYGGYDNYPTKSGIVDDILELPVLTSEDTVPYWDYMAYFIHNIQQQYADQLEAKSEYELDLMCQILGVTREEIAQRVAFTQPQYTNTFRVDELFEGYAGKRVKKGDWEPGNIPYVTATVANNGIDGYIGNPIIVKENLLTVNFFGDVFYQGGKVSFKDGTYGLKLRNKCVECKDVYLGLATHIQKQTKQMGSYDDGLRLEDINQIELELPVLAPNSKQIDWGSIRNVAVGGGGVNYLATRMEICNGDFAIIRQLIQ